MQKCIVDIECGGGDGTFQTHEDFPADLYPYSIAAGDLKGDV